MSSCRRLIAIGIAALCLAPSVVDAQYLGENLRGDTGLSAGSQPIPGIYFVVPFYNYDIDSIHNRDGNEISIGVFPEAKAWLPTVAVVTKTKVLGANYGFMVAPVNFMKDVIDVPRADLHKDTGFALYDGYYQPINLGWHTKKADVIAGYAFFAPTGDFDAGEGLGMWSHELSTGTTVYLGEQRKASVSTAAFYELHTTKKDTDIKVGSILTLEGGVAARFAKGAGAIGLAYYGQWKVTDDTGSDRPLLVLNALNLLGKQKVWGFGPEVTMPFFAKGTTVALATVRYFWETGATSSYQGRGLFVSVTLAKLMVP